MPVSYDTLSAKSRHLYLLGSQGPNSIAAKEEVGKQSPEQGQVGL